MELRPQTQGYLELCQQTLPDAPPTEEQISVLSATKHIASTYERFRNILEPDEIDILRRRAIARILYRRVSSESATVTNDPPIAIATSLLQELIRGNYLTLASNQQAITISQKITLLRRIESHLDPEQFKWLLKIAAVSIDRQLFSKKHDESLVHVMYHDTYVRTTWTDNLVDESDRPAQLFVACHRALFAAEDDEIIYHYFIHHFPDWEKTESPSEQEVSDIARQLPRFREDVTQILEHPSGQRIATLLKPVSVPYRVIRQLCQSTMISADTSLDTLASSVREAIQARGQIIIQRISARARHSVLFLLFTKTFLVLLIELPYERYLVQEVHWGALVANTVFHPLLLFFLSATVRLPGEENTEKIVEQSYKVLTGDGELPTIIMNAPRSYGATTWAGFGIIYTVLFIVIFWALILGLERLGFSLLAIFLFVFFLGLVSFLAMRNRRSVDDLRVIPKYEGSTSIFLSFLFLPVLEFGGFLARTLRQFNIPLFFMDRILEAPFKLLIDLAEEWFTFVRERREEIV